MSKIWVTRGELSRMIREALPDEDWASQVPEEMPRIPGPAVKAKPKIDPFPATPGQERVLEPDPDKTQVIRMRSPNPRVGRDPEPVKKSAPNVVPGGAIPRSKWVGPRGQPYSKEELSQGRDVTGDEPSDVLPAAKGATRTGSTKTVLRPSGRIRHSGEVGTDPTASEPYTKQDLARGADTEAGPKGPGLVDRLKGMFGGSSPKGYEEAPAHWNPQQKEKFHRERAIGNREKLNQYKKMFIDANKAGDEKKKAYAKKMHGFYADASNAHERALKGSK